MQKLMSVEFLFVVLNIRLVAAVVFSRSRAIPDLLLFARFRHPSKSAASARPLMRPVTFCSAVSFGCVYLKNASVLCFRGSFERIFCGNASVFCWLLVKVWGTAGSQERARLLQPALQPEFGGSGFHASVARTDFVTFFVKTRLFVVGT